MQEHKVLTNEEAFAARDDRRALSDEARAFVVVEVDLVVDVDVVRVVPARLLRLGEPVVMVVTVVTMVWVETVVVKILVVVATVVGKVVVVTVVGTVVVAAVAVTVIGAMGKYEVQYVSAAGTFERGKKI